MRPKVGNRQAGVVTKAALRPKKGPRVKWGGVEGHQPALRRDPFTRQGSRSDGFGPGRQCTLFDVCISCEWHADARDMRLAQESEPIRLSRGRETRYFPLPKSKRGAIIQQVAASANFSRASLGFRHVTRAFQGWGGSGGIPA